MLSPCLLQSFCLLAMIPIHALPFMFHLHNCLLLALDLIQTFGEFCLLLDLCLYLRECHLPKHSFNGVGKGDADDKSEGMHTGL